MAPPVVLVVDDEPETRRYLRLNLEVRGYTIVEAASGWEAISAFGRRSVDLILLDILLPDMSGYQVCSEVRKISDVPVVFLTATARERDLVRAFDAGADDYMTKPFGTAELMARVRAALRRRDSSEKTPAHPTVVGNLVIEFGGRRVWCHGREVALTKTELELLALLAKNANRVLTHRFILENVWGESYDIEKQYVRAYIYRLRSKLEDRPEAPVHLVSVPGVGYAFVDKHRPSMGPRDRKGFAAGRATNRNTH